MKHPAASSGVSGARAAKCGTATRLALHRLQIPPQGAGNLPTAIETDKLGYGALGLHTATHARFSNCFSFFQKKKASIFSNAGL
jgi:hypothetical protein